MKKNSEKKADDPKIEKKSASRSSSAAAASKGRSATAAVKADANTDVRGGSGLANTGPFVSYNDGE